MQLTDSSRFCDTCQYRFVIASPVQRGVAISCCEGIAHLHCTERSAVQVSSCDALLAMTDNHSPYANKSPIDSREKL